MKKSKLETMSQKEARRYALDHKEKWEQIVTDAFRFGYLTNRICLGCGKYDCGGCPAGTGTGWRPGLTIEEGDE